MNGNPEDYDCAKCNWLVFVAMAPWIYLMSYGLLVGIPCGLAWFYSMLVGSALARDDVIEVVREVTMETVQESSGKVWSQKVALPTMRLVTHTMADLSKGFGHGTGIVAIMCWSVSFTQFIRILKIMQMDDAGLAVDQTVCGPLGVCVLWAYGRHLTPMLATALAPLAVAADVAGVSSSCDVLYQRINGAAFALGARNSGGKRDSHSHVAVVVHVGATEHSPRPWV